MQLRSVVPSSIVFFSLLAAHTLLSATNVPAGTISTDTTWDLSGSPYVVACGGVTVDSGATLTVAPGVTVSFEYCQGFSFLGLSVNGKLMANGTSAQPITFTSITDDATSGWHGIYFNLGAGSISYANLRFGGMYFSGRQGMVYIATENLVSLSNNTLTNSFGNDVQIGGAAPTIQNNNFATVAGYSAISIDFGFVGTLSGNSATGPGLNVVEVRTGVLSASPTWGQLSMPYLVACGGVTVDSSATLTIAPGVTVSFEYCQGFSFLGLSVNGKLMANGTSAQPITFTSITDDANSRWHGIFFNTNASGSMSYANLRFGGMYFSGRQAMVSIATGNSLVSLSNNTFTNSFGYGVQIGSAAPTIQNNSFATVAGYSAISVDFGFLGTLSGNTATGTGLNGVEVRPGTLSGNATWGQVSMPYVIANSRLDITSFTTIGTVGTLAIQPGVVVKFAVNQTNQPAVRT